MQKVNIFIDTYHTGHLKKGTGTYCIVLEYITSGGVPATREYIEGLKGTTKNRTAIRACIAALEHMIKPCDIQITINSEHVTEAINTNAWFTWINTGKNAKGKPVKNMDLWQRLFELVDRHSTVFTYAERNSYTAFMQYEMNRKAIELAEDTINENNV